MQEPTTSTKYWLFAKVQMLREGKTFTREAFGECKTIRAATDSDYEFINYPPKGILVECCRAPKCDCVIVIYQPTPDDMSATDWKEVK